MQRGNQCIIYTYSKNRWYYDRTLFFKKCSIKRDVQSLIGFRRDISPISLQHQTLSTIYAHKHTFKIVDDESLMILASVRNPYTRFMSHLYFSNKIKGSMKPAEVETVTRNYFAQYDANNHIADNHLLPQHMFLSDLSDLSDTFWKKVHIVKQETLNDDMSALGYIDFENQSAQLLRSSCVNDYSQMTMNLVTLINTYYKEDFVRFNYDMITTEEQ